MLDTWAQVADKEAGANCPAALVHAARTRSRLGGKVKRRFQEGAVDEVHCDSRLQIPIAPEDAIATSFAHVLPSEQTSVRRSRSGDHSELYLLPCSGGLAPVTLSQQPTSSPCKSINKQLAL